MSKFNAFDESGAELARIAGNSRSRNQQAAQDEITRRADKRAAKAAAKAPAKAPAKVTPVVTPEDTQVEILLATLKAQAEAGARKHAQAWADANPGKKGYMRVYLAERTRLMVG